MDNSNRSCSGYDDLADPGYDSEFRDILDALFCDCLQELQTGEAPLRRDLFRLAEIDGQPLPAAARALGLEIEDAREMLAKTRRDIAVLMVLGLCKPPPPDPGKKSAPRNCRCHAPR